MTCGALCGLELHLLVGRGGEPSFGRNIMFNMLAATVLSACCVFVLRDPTVLKLGFMQVEYLNSGFFVLIYLCLASKAISKIGFLHCVLLMLNSAFLTRTGLMLFQGEIRYRTAAYVGILFLILGLFSSVCGRKPV